MRTSSPLAPLLVLTLAAGGTAVAGEPPPPAAAPVDPATGKPHDPGALSAAMEAKLRKAGFTDLQVLPESVLVRGKDKEGHAVAMVLNPRTMTEIVTLDPHAPPSGGGAAPLTGNATFATALPDELMGSRLIGTPVLSRSGETLGVIRDLAVDHGAIGAYVVRVGGILGIGARYAAVTPAAITFTFDGAASRYKATMDATPEQMKAAPEFKYEAIDDATR